MVVAVRALVLVLLAGACLTATAARPVAAADVTAYRAAVRQAAEILRAGPADTATARRAAQALRAGTGDSQQQVLADLDSTPPDIADARQRLDALDASLQQPADAPGRDDADRNLKEILAQPRYAEAGPNLVEQLIDWFLRLLARLFSAASGGSPLFALIEIGIVVGVLLLVGTLVLLRFMRATRGTGDARAERRR
ncbi:MAG: hypothetical protein QOE92_268, partial [Chloroflexota bacterium]|nr:hypothetical protein [Chloroflexota bacterium]